MLNEIYKTDPDLSGIKSRTETSGLSKIKQLQKKLSAFVALAILFSATANAQIIYTDVNPDVVRSCQFPSGCGGAYSLDLNNDGMNDYVLAPRAITFSCGNCSNLSAAIGQKDSAVVISTSQSWIADQVGGYALNTLIDSSLGWTNAPHVLALKSMNCAACPSSPSSYLNQSPATGTWINVSGKYLPLKVKVGTNIYYGWIKLGVGIGSYLASITIMEYAYNTIANQPILAGQTTIATGINENSFASSINLFPNPANNHLTIALPVTSKKIEVCITDITGKIIYTTTSTDTKNIEVSTKDFAEGIYSVHIQTADFIGTKKLVVEN